MKMYLILETTEVILLHCDSGNNNYQQNSRVLYAFVRNKLFAQLLSISPKRFTSSKPFSLKFSYIEV